MSENARDLRLNSLLLNDNTYLVTTDLESRMALLAQAGLKTPSADFFQGLEAGLTQQIEQALPNAAIKVLSMTDLANRVLEAGNKQVKAMRDAEIVSTCVEIASARRGFTLEINRLVDDNGTYLGHGARPGHSGLVESVGVIAKAAAGRGVVLVEDGAFTGKTLVETIHLFKAHKVHVHAVIIGFAFQAARNALSEFYDGEVVVMEEIGKPIDWMPDHDFFPFVPNCGKVVGIQAFGRLEPLYTSQGDSLCFPYIVPYCSPQVMAQWTGIPAERVVKLSEFCLRGALRMYEEIEKLNGVSVRISDLSGVKPRVSIPLSFTSSGQRGVPGREERITDLIHAALEEIH